MLWSLLMQRLFAGFLVIALVHAATFLALRLMPGDPWADIAGDRTLPAAAVQRLQAIYGQSSDMSLWAQYAHDAQQKLSGDFGASLKIARGYDVWDLLAAAAPVSLTIGCGALLLGSSVGLWAGMWAARRQGRALDNTIRLGSTLGISLPDFIVAPLLLVVFSLWLQWLPAGGIESLSALLLPIVTLAVPLSAQIARLTRASMVEELRADFVRTARAKGVGENILVVDHALRPACGPVLAYLATAAASVLTGSLVVESVFAIPGLGYFFVAGALQHDWTVVSGAAILYAGLLVGFNLLADLGLAWCDPRTRQA
jgi:oligopeptide transport system permease protein